MKEYEAPELEVIELKAEDVIKTSLITGENELPGF